MSITTTAGPDPLLKQQQERLADDLLVGCRAIADELGIPLHAVYYLAKKQRLPIGRLGRTLIASRKKLRRAADALTAA
jgi:hypothetical protein